MEMAQTDSGNTPKSYTLNMFKDFVPMCVFSESNQGKHMPIFCYKPILCILLNWTLQVKFVMSIVHTKLPMIGDTIQGSHLSN